MKVHELLELVPLLARADPEDIILINSGSGQVFLCNTRPGLHQPMDEPLELHLSDNDCQFLREIGIPP